MLAPFSDLTFDADHDTLSYEDAEGLAFQDRIDPQKLIRYLERGGPNATFVMAGTPLQAAAKLLLVHIDEDLATGKDPFRHLR